MFFFCFCHSLYACLYVSCRGFSSIHTRLSLNSYRLFSSMSAAFIHNDSSFSNSNFLSLNQLLLLMLPHELFVLILEAVLPHLESKGERVYILGCLAKNGFWGGNAISSGLWTDLSLAPHHHPKKRSERNPKLKKSHAECRHDPQY